MDSFCVRAPISPPLKALTLGMAALLVWGCGKSSSTTGAENSIANIGSPLSTNIATVQGVWKSGCKTQGSKSRQYEVEFSGNQIHFTERVYPSVTNCASIHFEERKARSSARLDAALTSPPGATSVMATPIGTYYVTASGDVAGEFNSTTFCGLSGWVSGEPKEIRAVDCSSALNLYVPFEPYVPSKVYVLGSQLVYEGQLETGSEKYIFSK